MGRYFAGIGSRQTPKWCMDIIYRITKQLISEGVHLRSGGANGADTMFEESAIIACELFEVENKMEIFLPRMFFNDRKADGKNYLYDLGDKPRYDELIDVAKLYHPKWNRLNDSGQRLMARNGQQVLGRNLLSPSELIVCYTPNGELVGGTAQALRIATDYDIPIFNVGKYETALTKQEISSMIHDPHGDGEVLINRIVENFNLLRSLDKDHWF